jgi:hypothetical protein
VTFTRRPTAILSAKRLAHATHEALARGHAGDRHNVGAVLAQALDPVGEAFGKERGRQRVHQVVERVMRGDALLEGKATPQKVELLTNPAFDLAEVLGLCHRRPAQNDQRDFGQRIDDLPGSRAEKWSRRLVLDIGGLGDSKPSMNHGNSRAEAPLTFERFPLGVAPLGLAPRERYNITKRA